LAIFVQILSRFNPTLRERVVAGFSLLLGILVVSVGALTVLAPLISMLAAKQGSPDRGYFERLFGVTSAPSGEFNKNSPECLLKWHLPTDNSLAANQMPITFSTSAQKLERANRPQSGCLLAMQRRQTGQPRQKSGTS